MALKPTSADRSIKVVWYGDPAVDQENSVSAEEYQKAVMENPSCWTDLLKFKDGQQPTKFTIGVIPSGDLTTIEDECKWGREGFSYNRMRWLCFLQCLRDIEGFPGVQVVENGRSVNRIPKRDGVNGMSYVDPVWLAESFVLDLRACALFVGGVAYRWNQLSEDDAKNS